jgi:hypothetical protein
VTQEQMVKYIVDTLDLQRRLAKKLGFAHDVSDALQKCQQRLDPFLAPKHRQWSALHDKAK